ncbi:MAG: hypothetical protein M3Y08_07985 [Fibrobacterota bacterium]|nr:hypothetical protein [Fibrobacterota bacterium]
MFRIPIGFLTLLLLLLGQPRGIEAAKGSGVETGQGGMQGNPSLDRQGKMLTAYALGIGGTVLPVTAAIMMSNLSNDNGALMGTLVLSGLMIGPSLGQFYAGSIGQGFGGLGIRALGGLLTMTGLVLAIGEAFCTEDEGHECNDGSDGTGFFILGAVTYIGGVVYSLVDTRFSVDRYYARKEDSYGLAPVLVPQGDGSIKTGATAWMRF